MAVVILSVDVTVGAILTLDIVADISSTIDVEIIIISLDITTVILSFGVAVVVAVIGIIVILSPILVVIAMDVVLILTTNGIMVALMISPTITTPASPLPIELIATTENV